MTAFLEATGNWAFKIDRGYVNAVVFLDRKKTFDTVNHYILLSKLNSYGTKGNTYELIALFILRQSTKSLGVLFDARGVGGGVTPLYKLYRNVPPHWIGFLHLFGLKTNIWFSRELQECMNVFIVSIPNK